MLSSNQRRFTHLFIELVDNALCPLQMQVLALQRPIDVSQFNAHLADQQPVILVGPINTCRWIVTHLRDQQIDILTFNIFRHVGRQRVICR